MTPINEKPISIDITGDYLVQKHRLLLQADMSVLTLNSLKLLDYYLSKINSHEPTRIQVTLEKGELERFLGIKRVRKETMDRITDDLLRHVIVIQDLNKVNYRKKISLFSVAEYDQDESGNWTLTLKCTPDAKPYVFDLETIGYVKYRRKLVENIRGMYEYALFSYILANKFRREWTVSIEELRKHFWIEKDYLQEFKRFNQNVLAPSVNALKEHGIIDVQYEPIRSWKTVTGVKFKVITTDRELNAKIPEDIIIEADAWGVDT